MEISDDKFEKIKKEAENFYGAIVKVKCPYLTGDVHFNTEGFQHLLFKDWNTTRTRFEQYTRLRLIKLAPEIIKISHTLQEYDERQLFVRQKINSRWEKRLKTVRYYVFVAIIDFVRLKIVIKEIEGGVKFFYSLYPSWRVEKDSNGNNKKIFFSGNLEID